MVKNYKNQELLHICDRVDIDCPSGRGSYCDHSVPHVFDKCMCMEGRCSDLPNNGRCNCMIDNSWINKLYEGDIHG